LGGKKEDLIKIYEVISKISAIASGMEKYC
ncbi:MAG: hypothetical protein ACI9IL_001177, partial [Rickettsiales bacterium]